MRSTRAHRLPILKSVETVTCGWCDEQTPPGALCAACGGDPAGPVVKPTGMQLVRDRRMAARQAMLDARRGRASAPSSHTTAPPPSPSPFTAPPDSPPGPVATDAPPALSHAWAGPASPEAAAPPAPAMPAATQPGPAAPNVAGPADWSSLAGGTIDDRLYAQLPTTPAAPAPPGMAVPPGWAPSSPAPTGRGGLVVAAVAAVVLALVAVAVVAVSLLGHSGSSSRTPAAAAATAAAAPKPWVAFTGPGFHASFPVRPTASTGRDSTPGGEVNVETWDASTPQGKYTVAYERLPISPDAGEAPVYLDAVVQDSADQAGATVSSMQRLSVGPFQAEDATMSAPEGSVNMRVLIHGADVWYLVGIGTNGPLRDYNQLLQSFDPALAGVPAPSPQGMT